MYCGCRENLSSFINILLKIFSLFSYAWNQNKLSASRLLKQNQVFDTSYNNRHREQTIFHNLHPNVPTKS